MDTVDAQHGEKHRSETLAWFQAEVTEALGDPSTADALTACIEALLADEETPEEDIMDGLLSILSTEGVPERIGVELLHRL